MSLINDALKRAQDSHSQSPPAASPPPTPVTEPETGGPNWMLISLVVLLAIFAFGFIRIALGHKKETVPPPTEAASQPVAKTNSIEEQPTHAAPAAQIAAVEPVTSSPAAPPESTAPETQTTNDETEMFASNLMKAAVITNAPLRLQGIIFAQPHPWAIVSGETVFVGDRVRGCRVTEITKYSVTLQGDDGSITKLSVGK
ncbi:MAG TPA: hypothetical protein VFV23_02680 [Verrucomicrobiae bacterium]|nr:hypothetical protein [Verrucomicrobiae bacterium]